MQLLLSIGLSALALPLLFGSANEGTLQARRLRVNALHEPVQAPSAEPVLSWIGDGTGRDLVQTSYQVQVASTARDLEAGRADLWDSGRVGSAEQFGIRYAGRALEPGARAFWRVRLGDAAGDVGPWSDVATFGAPLNADAWLPSDWIGLDTLPGETPPEEPELGAAQWIAPAADFTGAQAGRWTTGCTFELPAGARARSARAWVVADDAYELSLNGHALAGGGNWRVAEPVDLGEWLVPGANDLRVRVANHSPGPTALWMNLRIELQDGALLDVPTAASWTVGSADDASWRQRTADEPAVHAIPADVSAGIWRDRIAAPGALKLMRPRYLRSEFRAEREPERATLYLAGLGFADAYLNGELVSSRFVSDWTHYETRVLSRAFDVTEQVSAGDNALGLVLSEGWFSGFIGWSGTDDHWGERPRAAAQLVLEFADGSRSVVRTGPDWRGGAGPLQSADMLAGEVHDARVRGADGFSEAGFDDSAWLPVSVGTTETQAPIEPSPGPAIDAFAEFAPVAVSEPEPGTWIFDLGRNIAGVARLKLEGRPGQRIRLRFGERLDADGALYTTNLRGARAVDEYVCRGEGVEVWEPRFTFHGFQYVEVTGLEGPPPADLITGVAIGSLTPQVGRFACSSPMLDQLASNVYWTQRANFISVPTDCPQRDERLGWTGDAQVYVRTAGLWCDVQPFFDKWLTDLTDATGADGNPPKVAPVLLGQGDGGPAWSDAATICPWELYRMYGDRELLARQYPAMRAYVDFNTRRAGDDRTAPEQFHCFGDWVNLDDPTPNDVIFMAYWAESARLVAEAARVLGHAEDAEAYDRLRDEIVAAFNREHVEADGRVDGDSQTAYVLALRYGMVSGERREQACAHLLRTLEERDWHLATGFVGTKDLMLVLDRIGRNDVAYRLVLHEDYPSWGFTVRHGATSIWERWDGWTPERGFQDPGMNSFAHYSFGAVYRWMVETLGGIRLEGPGYGRFRIAPQPGGGLTFADVAVDTVRGPIESRWELQDGQVQLDVTIPANTRCTVVVPTGAPESIRVDGEVPGPLREGSALELGSGRYRITARS
jgi:alpha-L-rhamnosidase